MEGGVGEEGVVGASLDVTGSSCSVFLFNIIYVLIIYL